MSVSSIARLSSIVRPSGRRAAFFAAIVLVATTLAVTGCVAPPTIGSGLRPAPPDAARDPLINPAPSRGCATTVDALRTGRSTVKLSVGGTFRSALVDIPDAATNSPRPLLLSLHPFLMDPVTWDGYSGLSSAGTERGYVVVTPHGSDPGPRWAVPGGLDTGTDDLAFLGELLDYVQDHSCVDRNRVFAAGFSAGAAMAQALSCTMPDRFAAVAGSGGVNLTSTCPDSPPTDVLALHGSADPIVPPSGSQISFTPPTGLSVDAVVKTDAERAGCDSTPQVDRVGRGVVRSTYTGCLGGHRITKFSLLGAGHTWAGSPNPLLEIFTGPTNTDISATQEVLDFFDSTLRPTADRQRQGH